MPPWEDIPMDSTKFHVKCVEISEVEENCKEITKGSEFTAVLVRLQFQLFPLLTNAQYLDCQRTKFPWEITL